MGRTYSTEINREKSASEFKFHKMASNPPMAGETLPPSYNQAMGGSKGDADLSNPEPTHGTNPSPATGCPPDGHRRRSNANGRHDALQQMQPKRNDVFAYRF